MNWQNILKMRNTPNRFKAGYLLCANDCIRPVETGEIYCAHCGDDMAYRIPPPKGFKFDKTPPEEPKEAELGFQAPWVSNEQRDKAKDDFASLYGY